MFWLLTDTCGYVLGMKENNCIYLFFLSTPHTHLALIKLLAQPGPAWPVITLLHKQKPYSQHQPPPERGNTKNTHTLPLMLMPRTTCPAVVIGGTGGQHLCTARHRPSRDFNCSYKNLPKTAHRGPLSLQTSC